MSFSQLAIDNGRPLAITTHAWSPDRTKVAFCPNNNEMHIANYADGKFSTVSILREHDKVITSLDWSPKNNRIVSCSQDRNAYVWTFTAGKADPQPVLVMLPRLNRAAIQVKWSPDETKFALTTGQNSVNICYYEKEQDWWVSKRVENHNSSVLCTDWSPSGSILATGSSDNKVRLFMGLLKALKETPQCIFGSAKPPKPQSQLAEFQAGGWVHSVAFSEDGKSLAWAAHDSTLSIATIPDDRKPSQDDVFTLYLKGLPFTKIAWLGKDMILGVGHDPNPVLIVRGPSGWVEGQKLDDPSKRTGMQKRGSVVSDAFKKFESRSFRGESEGASTTLKTLHQNCITDVRVMAQSGGAVTKLSSVGLDGRLVVWDVPSADSVKAKSADM